ncbi:serine/threonine protein kinase [Solirubrobacter phytolaccae]|uniref:non-specific serine/threonine protein kinase n=1 Tax=Solirubrobacter phytolaccae TaxID=1404360 RepID=A0A9X3N5D7_9ACTN|nr:serine/threonine-protein kinase [Solirubrobacter phytolaccae]MDA0178770.1 serine/threonine protein kinase [Solirubrobacter phytolaccae]
MCAAAADAFGTRSAFSPGETVGDYVIEERLGAGGFGEVFLATELALKRQVALKFVRPEFAADHDFVRRFAREASTMATVEHPNIVPIYRHGQVRGRHFLSMRYVPGGSLADLLAARQLPLEDILDVLGGVAAGLDHCHARGIVHRDLKPANVLIDPHDGRGLLADFGIALTDDFSTITVAGSRIGTPVYMAPETLMGEPATPASDRWALAAMAYRIATGALPRGPSQPPGTAPVPLSAHNHRFGPDVDRVMLRALSVDRSRRHPSARAFVSELREALERPVHPKPPRRSATRRMWSVGGAALVLMPAMVYGVASLVDRGPACHTSYTGACLKADAGDYDCKGGDGDGPNYIAGAVRVVGRDDFGLDGDGDGVAC